MKKIIYIAAVVAMLFALPSSAQDVRGCKGFFELFGGPGVGTEKQTFSMDPTSFSDYKIIAAFGLNVTGGYQITNFLFAGVGFGGYAIVPQYTDHTYGDNEKRTDEIPAVMLPIFADVRWTLDLTRKINPFVDVKIGYQFCCSLDDGEIGYHYYGDDGKRLFRSQEPGFYFMPTIGVRFGKRSAFNLGFSYLSTIHMQISEGTYSNQTPLKKFTQGAFMLSLGADF